MGGLTSAMSVAAPIISEGIQIASQFSGSSLNSDNQALEELQARQNAQMAALQENAAIERDRIALAATQDEDARQQALKRAMARRRAETGASGITQSGSSEAVLLGLFEESEAEKAERAQLDSLRLSAIDQDIAQQNRLNVLQQTQLQQRQNLNQISSGASLFSSVSRLF